MFSIVLILFILNNIIICVIILYLEFSIQFHQKPRIRKDFRKKICPPQPPTPPPTPPKLSFLLATHHLILFCISTKYHQNIVKGIQITEWTRNETQTHEGEITPKVRKPELSFLYATIIGLVLHFYQVSSKYAKGYSFYKADRKSNSNTRRGDNSKSKKPKVGILVCTIKIFQRVFQLKSGHKINFIN